MFRIVLYLLVLTLLTSTLINAEEYPECEDEPKGNFIAVSSNCSKAIYCDGENSNIVECDFDTPYFSSDDQNCYTDSTVCDNRPFSGSSTTTPTSPTTVTTLLTSPTAVSTNITIPSPVTAITTWSPVVSTLTTKITSTTTDSTPSVICPPVDDPTRPVFLPHPKSCSQYYLCYHGVPTIMQCPNMMHFDVTQQSCNIAEKVNCQISADIPRDQCLPHTVDVYPHAFNCNYYYLCEYGYLMIMQCPFNMGWDYKKRACVIKSKAKCYNEASWNYNLKVFV